MFSEIFDDWPEWFWRNPQSEQTLNWLILDVTMNKMNYSFSQSTMGTSVENDGPYTSWSCKPQTLRWDIFYVQSVSKTAYLLYTDVFPEP